MQSAFSFLDSVVAEANATMTDGNRLDPIQVKAIFYALCFGESAPSQHAADRFVDCFFITEQRTRIVVTNMLRRGYSTEDICAIAECSEQLVDELRESLSE